MKKYLWYINVEYRDKSFFNFTLHSFSIITYGLFIYCRLTNNKPYIIILGRMPIIVIVYKNQKDSLSLVHIVQLDGKNLY